MNCINLIGNLGRDPEIKYLEGGKAVTKFTIAVPRRYGQDKTDWFNCEVWGKPAQTAVDYLKKGSRVGITGELNIETYTNKEGQERTIVIVNVSAFDLPPKPKPQDSQPQGQGNASIYDF